MAILTVDNTEENSKCYKKDIVSLWHAHDNDSGPL